MGNTVWAITLIRFDLIRFDSIQFRS